METGVPILLSRVNAKWLAGGYHLWTFVGQYGLYFSALSKQSSELPPFDGAEPWCLMLVTWWCLFCRPKNMKTKLELSQNGRCNKNKAPRSWRSSSLMRMIMKFETWSMPSNDDQQWSKYLHGGVCNFSVFDVATPEGCFFPVLQGFSPKKYPARAPNVVPGWIKPRSSTIGYHVTS